MYYNQVNFPDITQLSFIDQLIYQAGSFEYMALIQYDDIIDYLLLKDLSNKTINQLSYYLYIAYGIRSFDKSNINIMAINKQGINQDILDQLNSYINHIVYDDIMTDPSI